MSNHYWTSADERSLRKLLRRGLSMSDACAQMRLSESAVRRNAKKCGLLDEFPNCVRQPWTKAEIKKLKRLYPTTPTNDLTEVFGRNLTQIFQEAARQGIKKNPAYMRRLLKETGDWLKHSGKAYRYPKGNVPANKGLRRPGWSVGRMRETQFKKGHGGTNTMKIGHKREIEGYLYTKISAVPNVPYTVNWKPTHHLLWQKHHGPIPPGHCLIFKDGNRMNIRMSNLQLITRGENAVRNSMWTNYPPELAKVIQLRGVLKRRLKRKDREHEEQNRGPAQSPVRDNRNAQRGRQAHGRIPRPHDL